MGDLPLRTPIHRRLGGPLPRQLANGTHDRPLLENNKTVPFIADLMEKRRAKYEAAADIVIQTDGKSELEICEELIHRLREADANK